MANEAEKQELKARVEARTKELEARLAELKAEKIQDARDEKQRIEDQLAQIKGRVKQGLENLESAALGKLNELLKGDDEKS